MLIPVCGERLPARLELSVVSAKGLPIMNKSINSTDAFVEVRFADNIEKTDVVTSLDPKWESDIISFDTDEKELSAELLEFRVMDHDTYSANDSIGRVNVDCNILVEKMRTAGTDHLEEQFSLPIYDTLNGIRGELTFQISLHLLIAYDYKNYVQVFSGAQLPQSLKLIETIGLIYEIKTEKDPDYEWLDRIRSPRATNEARQSVIRETLRSAVVALAYKADKYQANVILGFQEHLDIEGSSTDLMTARVYGTAMRVVPLDVIAPVVETAHFPLLSIGNVPHAKQVGIGSLISARSIQVLEEAEDPEAIRKTWWNELRSELHQQAVSLGCDLILSYSENISIHEGVLLMGCSGTAVLTGERQPVFFLAGPRGSSLESESAEIKEMTKKEKKSSKRARTDSANIRGTCEMFHTSLVEGKTSFGVRTMKCHLCKNGEVVDFLLTTTPAPPPHAYFGPKNHIQVSISKKISSDPTDKEEYAHELSNILPFADHELFHSLLGEVKNINALGNAIFDARFTYSISDDLLACVFSGILVRLQCIPKDDAASPSMSNVLSFTSLQRSNDARRFSWGTVREAMRFKQANISNISLKILNLKPPSSDSLDDNGNSRGRSRINTLVGMLKKRQHEKEYMSHVIFERQISTTIGIHESYAAGNANAIAGVHISPNISSLILTREASESCPVISRWSDVFVREDLNNCVKDSSSLDAFVVGALEERIAQIRAAAALGGQCAVSHLRVACPQFTISKEHAHIIIHMSCDIHSIDY